MTLTRLFCLLTASLLIASISSFSAVVELAPVLYTLVSSSAEQQAHSWSRVC